MKMKAICFFKSFLAGLAIALGGLIYTLLMTYLPKNIGFKVLASSLFSIGLLTICFFKLNLLTGKVGFVLNGIFIRNDKQESKDAAINLLIMLVGNLLGAISFGLIYGLLAKLDNHLSSSLIATSQGKIISNSFSGYLKAFGYGVLCGVLVYIAVFLFKLFKNPALKTIGVVIPIGAFVYFGFHHCIANAFYFASSVSFQYQMITYFVTVLFANAIGSLLINLLFVLLDKLLPTAKLDKIL